MKKLFGFPMVLFLIVLFCAASPFDEIDEGATSGDYGASIRAAEDRKNELYKNDSILYYLDKGLLAHYAGRYSDSIELLSGGERAIEEAFTKSVTEEIASLILNDTVKTYAGEDYEDVFVNAFNALNYYHLDKQENAMVEIRRMNEKFQFLAARYAAIADRLLDSSKEAKKQEQEIKEARAEAEKLGVVLRLAPEKSDRYVYKIKNSALGRYLGVLFYRANRLDDDARVDNEALRAIFADLPELYRFGVPPSLEDELRIPAGMARINILSFTGLSPLKIENVSYGFYDNFKYVLPAMKMRPSRIARVEAVFEDGDILQMERLEDIEAVVRETFKSNVSLTRMKSMVRQKTKSTVGVTATMIVGAVLGSLNPVPGLGMRLLNATEQADLRVSRYFPARSYVIGKNVEPGTYSVTLNYYDRKGELVDSYKASVQAKAGELNLVEAVCLK